MRDLTELNPLRLFHNERRIYGCYGDSLNGIFAIPSPVDKKPLTIIASSGEGWEHVSVSRNDRCPSWSEMEHVKRQFFREDEAAMQLHPPLKDYVNCHPYCLHLWRPTDTVIPLPPDYMVGPR